MENTSAHEPTLYAALLTVNDVAATLAISRGSVYNLLRRGDLVGLRVGRRLRFTPAEVRAYIERSQARELSP